MSIYRITFPLPNKARTLDVNFAAHTRPVFPLSPLYSTPYQVEKLHL